MKDDLTTDIDIGTDSLLVIYAENGLINLINGGPLKAISYYWRRKIAKYQG